ncbi:N-acetylmuramoyl-L-alanine amidase [Pleurocapsales cyanobacterium LEGE 06147]|nr:N-acetylmuramoyl-L-alanine amidase [Pleurocapsales cyanobacterium LEGE 06147]
MKFRWLLLSFLGIFLFCSPAKAGKLLSWQYEEKENRLVFLTDEGVQPQAQLLNDPARLVIDLPGTSLGRETVKENYSGTIRSLRVGQFDEHTARIVLELAPGYTIDPQQVQFRGISSTQWMVNIPRPTVAPLPRVNRIREDRATLISSPPPTPIDTQTTSGEEENTVVSDSPHVRATRNGFFISIDGNKNNNIQTSRDGNTINFDLEGITLPNDLAAKAIAVNQYGVSTIEFTQTSSSPAQARVSLKVTEDNSNWLATFSSFRGLVLIPRGGVQSSITPTTTTRDTLSSRNQKTVVSGIELANNDTELLINANQALSGEIKENNNGFYEIIIPNAELAETFDGPELRGSSPISEIRVRQEGSSVLVLVTTRLGVRMGQIARQETNVLSLPLGRGLTSVSARNVPSSTPQEPDSMVIDIPQSANRTAPDLFPSRPLPSSLETSPAPLNRTLVVLDAGHGGQDPGTVGIGGLREKDIVLPITLDVADILKKQGIEVKLTRDSDYFISLQGRTDMANQINADLFISIHANAINLSRPDVNGLETYYYQTGRRLAEVIHWNILNSVNIRDRGIRRARFYVLRHSSMPSVLVEVGFVTGVEDAPRLKNPTHRRQLAEAIARGIVQYIKENRP